ncbi:ribonuclease PH [Picosynechococcus sp. NKBG15041c]|uniref:ribonuclease PH n=1 Tax=Picosynechococcus sp. NKBG15041c TaxID=1407650 RepID=UPI0004175186|nr:ribonuclease PH [Picosynechococcus sp. NKBG15041c]
MAWQRPDARSFDQLRPFHFELDFTKFAKASVLTTCGDTKVLCTVSVEEGVPPFLRNSGQGWLTAEYRMMPGSTPERQRREFMKLSGRTQEIQRLIGRSLRAALDLTGLGERTITIDADVLQADGGTRTTAITGGYVGLAIACERLAQEGILEKSPIIAPVAAISVGLIEGQAYLDLNYLEDVAADVDFNVVMIGGKNLIEVQGTAESGSYSRTQLNQMLDVAETGIQAIVNLQAQAIQQAI